MPEFKVGDRVRVSGVVDSEWTPNWGAGVVDGCDATHAGWVRLRMTHGDSAGRTCSYPSAAMEHID